MKRILVLGNSFLGLYKFRKELLMKLVENNEVFISLPDGDFVPQLKAIGCKFIETPMERRGTNPIKDLDLLKRYNKMLKEYRPDIVLTYTIKPNVYGGIACQLNKIPYVANVTGLGTAVENGGLMQFITTSLYKTGLKKAQKVFFQNQDNLDFMIKHGVVKDNYDLLPGSGVNIDEFNVTGYPDDKTVDFVYVGRMMTEKGFGLYIDTAEYIKNKYPQTRFHICGMYEDNYRERVDKLIAEGVLIFHGLVEDMAGFYKQIHCTIHATYYPEGMSNVLLESLASGRPIITTDRPGCKEIVDDGINGFVVKQKNLDDLKEKVEKFVLMDNCERKQMGLNGREKIVKFFNRQIVIDKYMKEIEK